jgi:uncharacterized protein (DUF433 family)
VQGFYKKDELELLIQRRQSRKSLTSAKINEVIVERYYQTRAIRRLGEAFETDHDRKTLIVMATGAGKTRTPIALCDLLMRCNWVKRVLVLAGRVALVTQAVNAFKKHLPGASPVNLVTEKDKEGRVFVSTYPTSRGRRRGIGSLDVVAATPGLLAEAPLLGYHPSMNYEHLITIEPGKRSGKPCIRGMRITVYDVLEYLASGMTEDEILTDFSELTREDIRACLSFAADRTLLNTGVKFAS